MKTNVKLDKWVQEILVDPLSKKPLKIQPGILKSDYGREYPIVNGVYDLRFLNNDTTHDQIIWKKGQQHFEKWVKDISDKNSYNDYLCEFNGIKRVYEVITVDGKCLDVGGNHGTLRMFLKADQPYVCCDPFNDVFNNIENRTSLIKAYPVIVNPINFICCDAEFLPFQSLSFDTVHMRSVIDHFYNPEQALNEAYRVLTPNGSLIIGLYIFGGKDGKINRIQRLKNFLKEILEAINIKKYKDFHVWHPTYDTLINLIHTAGFEIKVEHWQEGHNDTVCYFKCIKKPRLVRIVF